MINRRVTTGAVRRCDKESSFQDNSAIILDHAMIILEKGNQLGIPCHCPHLNPETDQNEVVKKQNMQCQRAVFYGTVFVNPKKNEKYCKKLSFYFLKRSVWAWLARDRKVKKNMYFLLCRVLTAISLKKVKKRHFPDSVAKFSLWDLS